MAWMDTISTAIGSAMDISGKIADTIARLTALERDIKTAGDDSKENFGAIIAVANKGSERHAQIMERLGALERHNELLQKEIDRLRDA